MIQEAKAYRVEMLSKECVLDEEQLTFYVDHFNPKRDRQPGKHDLKRTSGYEAYKDQVDNPIRCLSYWRETKKAITDVTYEDILPLRRM